MIPKRVLSAVVRATRGAIVFAPIAIAGFACSGGGASGTTGPGSGNARYYMRANIDGAAWAEDDFGASTVGARWVGAGLYTITGYSSPLNTTVLLTLTTIRGPGTYPLGVNFGVPGGTAQVSNVSSGWTTRLSGSAGTITITSLTNTEIIGTFTFVANGVLNAPTTSTKTVTSGTFDLPVAAAGAVGPVPDNAGSIISGTIGGQPFNLATIAVTTGQTRDTKGQLIGTTLVFGGSTDTQGMGASVSGITGIGTYPLTNASPATTMNASLTNGAAIQSWNSGVSTSPVGGITITSWSTTRAKGTFSATLSGAIGTSSVINVSGSFDVGLP